MTSFSRSHQQGFTMVEIIIALALLSIGILGIYTAFYTMVKLNTNTSFKLRASYLEQEGIEIVRNIRDNNFLSGATWNQGLTSCSLGCQADYKAGTAVATSTNQLQAFNSAVPLRINADGFYGYDAGTDTNFTRDIVITQTSSDVLQVTVIITWVSNGVTYNHQSEGYVYNWF